MQKETIIIAAALLATLGSTYYVFSPGDDPREELEIEIELLSEPVIGETNTVQAQENGTALAGETLYVNGDEHGELNDAGITQFTTPDTEELTLEISDTTKTITVNETDQVDEEPEKTELFLDSEPEVGEINRVILYINGERTSGETIYLNNEELGETSNTGTITFTTPNEEEITVDTDHSEIDSETFSVDYDEEEEEEEGTDAPEIEPKIALTGTKQANQELTITAEDSTADNEIQKYKWEILETEGGNEITTDTGETTTYTFDEAGDKTIQLQIEDTQGYTENTNKIIEIDEEPVDEVYLAHLEPSEGEVLDGPIEEFEFYAEVPEGNYVYKMEIGEETEVVEKELDVGSQIIQVSDIELSDAGSVNYQIEIRNTDDNRVIASKTENIEILRTWGEYYSEIINLSPEEQSIWSYQPEFSIELNEDLLDDSWFRIYLNDTLELQTPVQSDQNSFDHSITIEDPGVYEWYVELVSRETGETIKSEVRELETTENPHEGEENDGGSS